MPRSAAASILSARQSNFLSSENVWFCTSAHICFAGTVGVLQSPRSGSGGRVFAHPCRRSRPGRGHSRAQQQRFPGDPTPAPPHSAVQLGHSKAGRNPVTLRCLLPRFPQSFCVSILPSSLCSYNSNKKRGMLVFATARTVRARVSRACWSEVARW